MAYIKSEKHFINYFSKVLRGLNMYLVEESILFLKSIYSLSESIKNNTIQSLVDVICWELKNHSSSKEELNFFTKNILPSILEEAQQIKLNNKNYNFKYLIITGHKELELNYLYKNFHSNPLNEEALEELNKLENVFGVYLLYNVKNQLVYIGKSTNLKNRIPQSIFERNAVKFAYILPEYPGDIHILEPFLILKYKPLLNKEFKDGDKTSFNIKIPEKSKIFTFYKDSE